MAQPKTILLVENNPDDGAISFACINEPAAVPTA